MLLELKDASKRNAEIYYSPFQLLQYTWEWQNELEHVLAALQKVIEARKRLGLASKDTHDLKGGIRPAVGFGSDARSSEVRRRYEMVLEVANNHLPEGIARIETWEYTDVGSRIIV